MGRAVPQSRAIHPGRRRGSADFSFGAAPRLHWLRSSLARHWSSRNSPSSSRAQRQSSPRTLPASTAFPTWSANPSPLTAPAWQSSCWSRRWENSTHVDRSKVRVVYLNPPEAAAGIRFRTGRCLGDVEHPASYCPQPIPRSQHIRRGTRPGLPDRLQLLADQAGVLGAEPRARLRCERPRSLPRPHGPSANSREAETLPKLTATTAIKSADTFIAQKRQYHMRRTDDQDFLTQLQRAADWLYARKVLPGRYASPTASPRFNHRDQRNRIMSVEFIGYVGHFNSSETMKREGPPSMWIILRRWRKRRNTLASTACSSRSTLPRLRAS